MKTQMVDAAAKLLATSAKDVEYSDGTFTTKEKELSLDKLAQTLCSFGYRDQLVSTGTFGSATSPPPFVAGFAEVEVDLETGNVQLKITLL